ncbi:MAG TPA: phosphopantetheine-binding protein [Terriglobales bacterium]|nr:phosphopantetheine-binding protein [Terriglobales bacterium]
MTEDSVVSKVLEIIAKQKRIPADQVTIDSTFQELGLDSLDAVNILFELEGEFNVSISDEQARQIKDVRQMVEGVTALVAEKKTA